MKTLCKIFVFNLLICVTICTAGCARRVAAVPPAVAFQTETYAVIQTSPDTFTVLTRSNAAVEEIAKRLGCDKEHICAKEWNGELFRIQRIK